MPLFSLFQTDLMPNKTNQEFPADLPVFNADAAVGAESPSVVKATPKNAITGKGKTIEPKKSNKKKESFPSTTVINSDSESDVCDLTQNCSQVDQEKHSDSNKGKRQSPAAKRRAAEHQLMSVMTDAFEKKAKQDNKPKNEEPLDEFAIFGEHIACEIRSLPDKQAQVMMKHAINSAIYDVQISLFQKETTKTKTSQASPVSPISNSGKKSTKQISKRKKSYVQVEPDAAYGYEGPNPYKPKKKHADTGTGTTTTTKVKKTILDTIDCDDDTSESVATSEPKRHMRLRAKTPTSYFLG